MNGRRLLGHRSSILILHGETFLRTDLDTEVTYAAFETIDLPLLAVFGYHNSIRGAAPAAQSAEDALVDIHVNVSPGQRHELPFLFWIHQRCGSAEQVLGHGFGHREYSHFLPWSPFCAADAGI